jgi:hypothetical protein
MPRILVINERGKKTERLAAPLLKQSDSGDFLKGTPEGPICLRFFEMARSLVRLESVRIIIFCGLKRKKRTLQKDQTLHHNVYVILLDDAVAKHRSILQLNPKRDPLKPCVYVGMTGLPIDHRFENHKNGYKSAWVVRKYGVRLMPELYERLNPMPFEAAVQMEAELAEDLRAAGYTVAGGH